MMHPPEPSTRSSRPALPGQGGLIAAAVTIMIVLVIAGGALGNMSFLNAQHSVVTKQTLQTYYAAQAGIQEAIATRMLPRSNYLNFNNSAIPGSPGFQFSDKAYYSRSGKISEDPQFTDDSKIVAQYRYMVLGGDGARKPDGDYYKSSDNYATGIPKLLSTDVMPQESPFIVISQGVICKNKNSRSSMPLPGKFQDDVLAKCSTDTEKDELYIVAEVNMLQGTGIQDQVKKQRIFKRKNEIVLPQGAFVPGVGWVDKNEKIDFEAAWNYTDDSDAVKNPLKLYRVVFYDFANNKVEKNCEIYTNNKANCNGTTADEILDVPANAAIRLYFSGSIDHRSISPRKLTVAKPNMDATLSDCRSNVQNCNIRVWDDVAKKNFQNNTIIPLFPGSSQVILLPPMVALTPNRPHELRVDTTKMRSANNQAGPHDYRIKFRTK